MLGRLREATTGQLMHVELMPPDQQPALQPVELPPMEAHHIDPDTGLDEMEPDIPPQIAREMAMADAAMAGARANRFAPAEAPKRQPLQTRKGEGGIDPNDPATWGRVSRNAECPCGSGKKYKHCHGKLD